jgi:hypothetical protein
MIYLIPRATDPMAKYFDMPNRDEIVIDQTHAVMTEKTFDCLKNYSLSNPSGVYQGKMWKRKRSDGWFICWFTDSEQDGFCDTNTREIIILK